MDATLLNDSLTLEQKLELIDAEIIKLQNQENKKALREGRIPEIVDPQDALNCQGCQ